MSDPPPLAAQWNEALRQRYAARGLGARTGFGTRACVLVVDMMVAFTDPTYAVGAEMPDALEAVARLLEAARAHGVMVMYVVTTYRADLADAGLFLEKIPAARILVEGTPAVEIHPQIAPRADEMVICKKTPSPFFMTPLASFLMKHRIDTVILSGCSTSGCIRAAAIDAMSHGFRTVVPLEAVADRAAEPHWTNLLDIDSKYGDVMPLDAVVAWMGTSPPG